MDAFCFIILMLFYFKKRVVLFFVSDGCIFVVSGVNFCVVVEWSDFILDGVYESGVVATFEVGSSDTKSE